MVVIGTGKSQWKWCRSMLEGEGRLTELAGCFLGVVLCSSNFLALCSVHKRFLSRSQRSLRRCILLLLANTRMWLAQKAPHTTLPHLSITTWQLCDIIDGYFQGDTALPPGNCVTSLTDIFKEMQTKISEQRKGLDPQSLYNWEERLDYLTDHPN